MLIASSLIDPVYENRLVVNTKNGHRWEPIELKKLEIKLDQGRLTGSVLLEKKLDTEYNQGNGSYEAEVLGFVEAKNGKLTRFDVLVNGQALDNFAPRPPERVVPTGQFPMAFAFTIVDKEEDLAKIPFQSMYRDNPGYRDPNIPSPLNWDLKKVPAGVVK